jgi:hypothetical protein
MIVEIEACRTKGHLIYETFNGLSWCRRCHEKTDDGFAADAHHLLSAIRNERNNDVSCHEMARKDPEDVLYPPNLNIYMGTPSISQKRRAAYLKAMSKDEAKSLADWARQILDQAAGFEESK